MRKSAPHKGSDRRDGDHSSARKRDTDIPRLDAANLAGLTTLMNPQNVKPNTDLDAAEKSVMGKSQGKTKVSDVDPVKLYNEELGKLAGELGIDLLDDAGSSDKAGRSASPLDTMSEDLVPRGGGIQSVRSKPPSQAQAQARPRGPLTNAGIDSLIDDIDLDQPDSPPGGRNFGGSSRTRSPRDDTDEESDGSDSSDYTDESNSGDSEYTDESRSESDDDRAYSGDDDRSGDRGGHDDRDRRDHREELIDDEVDEVISKLEGDLGIRTESRDRKRHKVRPIDVPQIDRHPHKHQSLTEEQERRSHINSVLHDMRKETRTTFGTEKERIQDIKAGKLEQIGQLRMTLEEEGIDTKSVTNPTQDSPMEEIDSVLNILRLKNDRNRYSSLAEEVVLGLSEAVETVFDGSRRLPVVGWKPDYTGYHNTVNCKLHRMRFETSQVVGSIIEKYNIGPTGRIILELLPSFFLYPRQQKKQKGTPGLHNDPQVADARQAYAAIRDSDENRDLANVRDL
jgi:hypothetical protein